MELIQKELLYAALGTGATCLATVLGAAMVFFFRHAMSHILQKAFLGFAAGVMIAASVWSLLIPAMEMAEAQGRGVLLPVGGCCWTTSCPTSISEVMKRRGCPPTGSGPR